MRDTEETGGVMLRTCGLKYNALAGRIWPQEDAGFWIDQMENCGIVLVGFQVNNGIVVCDTRHSVVKTP